MCQVIMRGSICSLPFSFFSFFFWGETIEIIFEVNQIAQWEREKGAFITWITSYSLADPARAWADLSPLDACVMQFLTQCRWFWPYLFCSKKTDYWCVNYIWWVFILSIILRKKLFLQYRLFTLKIKERRPFCLHIALFNQLSISGGSFTIDHPITNSSWWPLSLSYFKGSGSPLIPNPRIFSHF